LVAIRQIIRRSQLRFEDLLEVGMRLLTLAIGFCVSVATLAQAAPSCPSTISCLLGAPAPLIGSDIPVAAGTVLCGMMPPTGRLP
jgi:hypothetical protein